jgi:hypothetical protein
MAANATQRPGDETIAPVAFDEKPTIEEIEGFDGKGGDPDVIMKSPFEDLPWKKTWFVFRKAALMCIFASFSAAAE